MPPNLLTPTRLNVPAPVSTKVLDAPSPTNVVVASKDEGGSIVQVAPASTITLPKLMKFVPNPVSVPAPVPTASSIVELMPPPATVPPNVALAARISRSVPLPKETSVAPPPLIVPAVLSVPSTISGEPGSRLPPAPTESIAPLATLIDAAVSAPLTDKTPPLSVSESIAVNEPTTVLVPEKLNAETVPVPVITPPLLTNARSAAPGGVAAGLIPSVTSSQLSALPKSLLLAPVQSKDRDVETSVLKPMTSICVRSVAVRV